MASEQLTNNAATTLSKTVGVSDQIIQVNSTAAPMSSSPNFRLKIDSEQLLVTQVNPGAPTSAPSLSAAAGSTPFHTGTFSIGYTYTSPVGETALSPTANVTLANGQQINVAQITNVPSWVTSVRFYLASTPPGDTIGFSQAASPAGGNVGPLSLTSEGNGTNAPGVSPGNTYAVTRGVETSTAATHNAGAPVVANLTAGALSAAFVRLDTAASQSLTGPLIIPTSLGGSSAPTSYGSSPIKLDEAVANTSSSITLPRSGSIPTGFREIEIKYWGRGDVAQQFVELFITVNGDTSANYGWQWFQANGTGTSINDYGGVAQTSWMRQYVSAASAAANTIGSGRLLLHNYADTTTAKLMRNDWQMWGTPGTLAAAGGLWVGSNAGIWFNVAAITSVNFRPSGGNILKGVWTLWGYP